MSAPYSASRRDDDERRRLDPDDDDDDARSSARARASSHRRISASTAQKAMSHADQNTVWSRDESVKSGRCATPFAVNSAQSATQTPIFVAPSASRRASEVPARETRAARYPRRASVSTARSSRPADGVYASTRARRRSSGARGGCHELARVSPLPMHANHRVARCIAARSVILQRTLTPAPSLAARRRSRASSASSSASSSRAIASEKLRIILSGELRRFIRPFSPDSSYPSARSRLDAGVSPCRNSRRRSR